MRVSAPKSVFSRSFESTPASAHPYLGAAQNDVG